jgi:hypothetical protein
VQGEASLIAEDVERFAVRVVGGGGVVFALVEEGSGLLAFEGVEVELDAVHLEGGRSLLALAAGRTRAQEAFPVRGREARRARRSRLASVSRSTRRERFGAPGSASIAWVRICKRENVVVAIDDQAGQKIGFAEDDAVCVGVVDDGFAVGDRLSDALAEQGGKSATGSGEIRRMAICEELE